MLTIIYLRVAQGNLIFETSELKMCFTKVSKSLFRNYNLISKNDNMRRVARNILVIVALQASMNYKQKVWYKMLTN